MKEYCFIIISFLITSCSPIQFHADFDENTVFNDLISYNKILWNSDNDSVVNEINKYKIISAVKQELYKRNIKQSNFSPSITININIIRCSKIGTSSYTDYGGYYGYGYYRPMGYSITNYYNYSYTEGAIVIDVFDNKNKKLIWQGTAKEDFNNNSNPDITTDKIKYIIKKTFQKYPVKPLKK
jgi:hypothetical protein